MAVPRWQWVFAIVGVLAPVLALLPPRADAGLMWTGWGVAVACVVAIGLSRTSDAARWMAYVTPLGYVVAVVLLRESQGGGLSGFSPLLLLPLFWVALTGDRVALWILCVAIGLGLILPIILIGAPVYPSSEWRRAVIWLLIAPTAGLATQGVVDQVRRANQALENLVRTDPLTSLLNRRGFMELAERELLRARRTNESVIVAMLDLDHFKRFNDTRGHAEGDRLLVAAAAAWQDELRDIDILARWGGEEFIILLPRCPVAVAHNVLNRVRSVTPDGQTVSVGLSAWRVSDTLAEVTRRADASLYEAKDRGRNRVVASP